MASCAWRCRPALPGWLFDAEDKLTFTFLGHTPVTIHNPRRVDTWRDEGIAGSNKRLAALHLPGPRLLHSPFTVIASEAKQSPSTGLEIASVAALLRNDDSATALLPGRERIEFAGGIIPAPYAAMVRAGQVTAIDLFLT